MSWPSELELSVGDGLDADHPPEGHGCAVGRNGKRGGEQLHGESDKLPEKGRLVWVPPEGPPREVTADGFARSREAADAGHSCPDCGEGRAVETVVREHVECGHVGLDGFLRPGDDAPLACPKCGTEDGTGDRFPVVASVYSCVRCGLVMDRPIGGNGDGS